MSHTEFTLDDWLFYLENQQQPEIQLGLTRVSAVAERLGLLVCDPVVITVAGTNGKGSTVATLEAIYDAAGYAVASYTSPHLLHVTERFRVNGVPISEDALCDAFSAVDQARKDIHLTYFESATLAALYYFKSLPLDVIILEVGMGGRLDATNIIDSDVAIITTIDLDHQAYLGDTKDAIGYEKAGILRPNKPFIYADEMPPDSIIACASSCQAQMITLGHDYFISMTSNELLLTLSSGKTWHVPRPNLNHKAAAAAMMAALILDHVLPISQATLDKAMRLASISGRQQLVHGRHTTLFDVAHNPQAVTLLSLFVQQYQPKGTVRAVFSGLKDKDLCDLIKPMLSCVDVWYPAILTGPRAAQQSQLSAAFDENACAVTGFFSTPRDAYMAAVSEANPGDLLIVYGSFLTVSAIMANNRVVQEELL